MSKCLSPGRIVQFDNRSVLGRRVELIVDGQKTIATRWRFTAGAAHTEFIISDEAWGAMCSIMHAEGVPVVAKRGFLQYVPECEERQNPLVAQ